MTEKTEHTSADGQESLRARQQRPEQGEGRGSVERAPEP